MTPPSSRTLAASALAVAVLALLVAVLGSLGGASYAGGLAKGVVGKAQLKKNAVTSAKVKDGSLQARDFAAGQLPAGPRGPSDVWSATKEGFDDFPAVLTLALPAGSYYVSARAGFYTPATASTACTLKSSAGGPGDYALIAAPAGEESSGHLQAVFTLPQPGSVTLDCQESASTSVGRMRIDAIAVATTH
jgi:hypothetical protein